MPLTQSEKDRLEYLEKKFNFKKDAETGSENFDYPSVPFKEPPKLTWDQELGNAANAFGRGLEPYALAAGMGAAAGAPVGGVGAVPGALAGAGTLVIGDLAATGYNALTPFLPPEWNAQPIISPSDVIRKGTDIVRLTKPPNDPLSRMAHAAGDFGGSAVSGAPLLRGAGQLISKVPGTIGAFGKVLSQKTSSAAAAGAGLLSGAATQAAEEAGVPDVFVAPLSIAASVLGGKYAEKLAKLAKITPPNPGYSSEELREQARNYYDIAHDGGPSFSAPAFKKLTKKAIKDAISPSHPTPMPMDAVSPKVIETLAKMNAAATKRGFMASRELDYWRQELNKILNELSGPQKAVGKRIIESLDDARSSSADVRNNKALAKARESAGIAVRTAFLEDAVGGTPEELRAAVRAFVKRPDFNQVPKNVQNLAFNFAHIPNNGGATIKAIDLATRAGRMAVPGPASFPIDVFSQITKTAGKKLSETKSTRDFLNLINQISLGKRPEIPAGGKQLMAETYFLTTPARAGIEPLLKEDEKLKREKLADLLAQ